jgi:hypothetical protein
MAKILQWGVCGWGGGVWRGGEAYGAQASWLLSHLKRGVRGGGRRFVLDKQAMFAYLPSAFSPPSISILQYPLRLFLAGCEALFR